MRSQEVMRKVGVDKDQQGRWKILEMCWMTVGLETLVLWGGKFTWCNGHPNDFTIWERLDRVVATIEWLGKFLVTKVIHLECGSSDHRPILICLNGIPKLRKKPW